MKSLAVLAVLYLLFTFAILSAVSFKLPIANNVTERQYNPCVKAVRFLPHITENVMSVECNEMSFSCLSSVATHGYPKCEPVYKAVELEESSGNKNAGLQNVTIDCQCSG